MIVSEPTIDDRDPRPYVSLLATPTMDELGGVISTSLPRLFAWLDQHQLDATGPPFIRFNVIDMDRTLQVEIGVPVDDPVAGDGVVAGELPSGRFASLVYADPGEGVAANAALLAWIAEQGLEPDSEDHANGEAFTCRVEWLLDGPDDDPDRANWRTEVAIKLA